MGWSERKTVVCVCSVYVPNVGGRVVWIGSHTVWGEGGRGRGRGGVLLMRGVCVCWRVCLIPLPYFARLDECLKCISPLFFFFATCSPRAGGLSLRYKEKGEGGLVGRDVGRCVVGGGRGEGVKGRQ